MPELPDITVYLEALHRSVVGEELLGLRIASPFLVRSVSPRPSAAVGRQVVGATRLGKRIVLELDGELYLVVHLMIAGRLRWKKPGATVPRRNGLAAFDFANGTLLLTEASSKKRASLHVVAGDAALASHDPGGLELLEADARELAAVLRRDNHTLKRALTDPRIVSGVGNAYSDEILHRAQLSPFKRTADLSDEEIDRLFEASVSTLGQWIERLRDRAGESFPDKVTAFHPEMAVHGRYRQPCPACSTPVQRIIYAENEANYCPGCQTGGKLLADRVLSRLMKGDWPRTIEELERRMSGE